MTNYMYKTFREGTWHIYSEEYANATDCLKWYLKNGAFLEALSNRKLVLFKGGKKSYICL